MAAADAPLRYGGAESLVGGPAVTEGGICYTNAVLAGTHGALLAKCSVLYLAGGCADNMREALGRVAWTTKRLQDRRGEMVW